ncbi:MAG: hypothetical protein H0V04_08150 [Chloroflexi bacterium]|nr:hypothetical protein [Chloroflexota bacterium]
MERHLDVEALLAEEARELLVARKRGAVVHRTGDFHTAGAEFEAGFRAWLTRRLPIAYKVSHGHLVDTNRVSSPQLDVIVADGLSSLTALHGGRRNRVPAYRLCIRRGRAEVAVPLQ